MGVRFGGWDWICEVGEGACLCVAYVRSIEVTQKIDVKEASARALQDCERIGLN